jgi:hypothetical protein
VRISNLLNSAGIGMTNADTLRDNVVESMGGIETSEALAEDPQLALDWLRGLPNGGQRVVAKRMT